MTDSSSDGSSSSDTHQVLALAVGLGVGVPAVLAVLVIIFFTVRHRKLAREEDKRHEEIDLDREISFHAERAKRRHRPIPGSTTYLAKQHAASKRDLTVRELGSEDRLVMPPSKGNISASRGSLVSHESAYMPYAQEEGAASAEDLTRDLGVFEAPKYPRIPQLHSSSSSGSLAARDEWSRRASLTDSACSSPMVDRQKSQGHSTVLKLYDVYQPRFDEQRRPSTLREEDERRSPFESHENDESSGYNDPDETRSQFSFEDRRDSQAYDAGEFVSAQDLHAQVYEHTRARNDAKVEAEPAPPVVPQPNESTETVAAPKAVAEPVAVPVLSAEAPAEVPAEVEPASPTKSEKRRSFVPVQHYHEESDEVPSGHINRASSVYEQTTANQLQTPAQAARASSVYDQPMDQAMDQSLGSSFDYESKPLRQENSYNISGPGYNHSFSTNSMQSSPDTSLSSVPMPPAHGSHGGAHGHYGPPKTPQLDSSPLSPSTPLHSVPFSPVGHRVHTPSSAGSQAGSRPGSRRGSLSEYMPPDVPMVTPRSPRYKPQRNGSGNGLGQPHGYPNGQPHGQHTGQSTLDSSMFFEKPKKFGKHKGVIPSASQIAL